MTAKLKGLLERHYPGLKTRGEVWLDTKVAAWYWIIYAPPTAASSSEVPSDSHLVPGGEELAESARIYQSEDAAWGALEAFLKGA